MLVYKFCSLVNAIEMCKTEGASQVDVFQVIKALRNQLGAVLTAVRETIAWQNYLLMHHNVFLCLIIPNRISISSSLIFNI